jgi:hypothetical protein
MILDNQQLGIEEVAYHLQISHGSAQSSTPTLALIRCVQNGFPNNSQKSTNATVCPYAEIFLIATVRKVTPF